MKRWTENEGDVPLQRVAKRSVSASDRIGKRSFQMNWSQRGHDIYIIFVRALSSLDFSLFDVALTDRSCTVRTPGSEKHGWNFFMEVVAKDAQRIQNGDRLIIIVPKKDPSLYWTDLKKSVDIAESKDIKLSSVASDEPPPEKIRHQAKDLETDIKSNLLSTVMDGSKDDIVKEDESDSLSAVKSQSNISSDPSRNNLHHHLTSVKSNWRELGPDIVVFTLFVPHLDPWGTNVSFSEDHIQICFKTADEDFHKYYGTTTDVLFMWNVKLNKKIIPTKSTHKVTLKLMEIRLYKKDPVKWNNLTSNNVATDDSKQVEGCGSDARLSSGDNSLLDEDKPSSNKNDPSSPNSVTTPKSSVSSWNRPSTSKVIRPSTLRRGYTGLDNVGNTCFMNSVLQALANTRELRDFFLDNCYKKDINRTNPLGMRGRMAEEIADIMHKLWRETPQSFAPIKFRRVVGEQEPRFVDLLQHDAQEFMAFLLDKLHEDMNRVKHKPNYEMPEVGDRDDRVVAEESWKLHISRNDSFIVDLYHGMFKSKLYCPVCKNNSVKFDPFLFLSVPLPKVTRIIRVFFFPKDLSETPVKVSISVSKQYGKALEIFNHISSLFKCSIKSLRMFEVYKNRIHRFFVYDSTLEKISSTDTIFVQETVSCDDVREPVFELAIQQQQRTFPEITSCSYCKATPSETKIKRCTKCLRNGYCNQECQKSDWPQHRKVCQKSPDLVGYPFLVSIPQSRATCAYVKNLLWQSSRQWMNIQFYENGVAINPPRSLDSLLRVVAMNWNGSIKSDLPHLEEFGDDLLDLSHYKLLSLIWETDARLDRYVQVSTKPLNYICHDRPSSSNDVNLHNCIRLFTEPEVLAPQEAWYCPTCKEHQEATKEMSLWQLPDILIVQLKRFSFKNLLWRDKIDMFVDFPVDGLDMSQYCANPPDGAPLIYDLFAVVNHYGGIYGGHYTTFVRLPHSKNSTDNEVGWRVCDDSHVMDTSAKHVVTKAAYVMFYKKRNVCSSEMEQPTPQKSPTDTLDGDDYYKGDSPKDKQSELSKNSVTSITLEVPKSNGHQHTTDTTSGDDVKNQKLINSTSSIDNQLGSNSSLELNKPVPMFSRQMSVMDDSSSQDISLGCIIEEPLLKYDEIFSSDRLFDTPNGSEGDVPTSSKEAFYSGNSPSKDFESLVLRDVNSADYTDMDAVD